MKNIKKEKKKKTKKQLISKQPIIEKPKIIINAEKPKEKIKTPADDFLIGYIKELKQKKEKGNIAFMKDDKKIMFYETNRNILYVDYKGLWNILEINFEYTYQQIKDLFIFAAEKLYKFKKIKVLITI